MASAPAAWSPSAGWDWRPPSPGGNQTAAARRQGRIQHRFIVFTRRGLALYLQEQQGQIGRLLLHRIVQWPVAIRAGRLGSALVCSKVSQPPLGCRYTKRMGRMPCRPTALGSALAAKAAFTWRRCPKGLDKGDGLGIGEILCWNQGCSWFGILERMTQGQRQEHPLEQRVIKDSVATSWVFRFDAVHGTGDGMLLEQVEL